MEKPFEQMYIKFACAYARGMAIKGKFDLPASLIQKNLDDLTEEENREIITAGKAAGLKFYYFKKTHDDMPRVTRVLGFLRSIDMENLLDVGSGRGVFLWPCMNMFPHLCATGIDLLPHRVELLDTVRQGGVRTLSAKQGDIRGPSLPDKSFDVVAMLEVLEHIPDVFAAICSAVRIAKKYIVVTVPSNQDDNPEHIRLLTKKILTELFEKAGCARLHFDGVAGHLMMIAVLNDAP